MEMGLSTGNSFSAASRLVRDEYVLRTYLLAEGRLTSQRVFMMLFVRTVHYSNKPSSPIYYSADDHHTTTTTDIM